MTTTLPGAPGDSTEWLRLIDGDHGWRQDGAPVFAPGGNHGGNGNMPLFESCVLRDMGFRTLFDDWENDDTPGIGNSNGVLDPAEDFPDLLDTTSTDPNDPNPPTSALTVGTPQVVQSGTTWVTPATSLTINASDDFWHPIEIKTAISIDGTPTTSVSAGVAFSLGTHADGLATIGHQPSDPCRTGAVTSNGLMVDGTPPTVTVTAPVADPPSYDTDDFVPVAYSANDGAGVGVDTTTFEVRLDGTLVPDIFTIDTYLLNAGLHTLKVSVADKLGNVGEKTVSFRVRATSASLLNNIKRARTEGKITSSGTYNGLVSSVDAAVKSHGKGKHDTEWNQLLSARNILVQDAPAKVDQATATRFIGYIDDMVAARV
jgi:hypothetical protein